MECHSSASRILWRVAITGCLCLLAFLFALEAKTAWYGPVAGPGSDVRAAKAMRADTPQVIEHGAPVHDPSHPQIPFVLLPALALLWLATDQLRSVELSQTRLGPRFSVFSPQLFLRPPPSLS